jgi:signal transduction histidine kinase/HD-like signal output (HDOD) protein
MDPAFCIRMFRLQTAESCMTVNPNNLEAIITQIDLATIRHMALCAAMVQAAHPDEGHHHLRFSHFWQHAHQCASLAREIAAGMCYPFPQEAFLVGLLHDVGKLLMWTNFPQTYGFYFDRATPSPRTLQKERHLLGITHSEIGALFLRELNLPSLFTDAVRFHHRQPAEIVNSLPLVRIVYAANRMTRPDLSRSDMENLAALLAPELKAAQLSAMRPRAEKKFQTTCRFLGLMPTDFTHHHVFSRLEKIYPVRSMLSEVEEMSLVPGLLNRLLQAHDRNAARRTFLVGLHILFDIHKALFFQCDPSRRVLHMRAAHNGLNGTSADGLELPLREGSNLPSLSLINDRILDSFGYLTERGLSIVDKQLIAALGDDGMICIPLKRHGRFLGLIAGGLREVQIPRLIAQLKRLREFAAQAAVFLDSHLPERSVVTPPRAVLEDSVRKIVHEVNNPLGIIKNYLGTLEGEDAAGHSNPVTLGLIQDEIDRVGRLIERLGQETSGASALQIAEPVDLNRVITDLDRLLEPSVFEPAGVRIKYSLASNLPHVRGDCNALIQVFLNLFKNAVEAMPQGGSIRVQTACRRPAAERHPSQVMIMISDTGSGLAPTTPAKLFKPGISTKDMSNGGLGLAIVKDIIRQHDGTVFFQNRRGKGTTVIIQLPVESSAQHQTSGGQDGGTPRDLYRG